MTFVHVCVVPSSSQSIMIEITMIKDIMKPNLHIHRASVVNGHSFSLVDTTVSCIPSRLLPLEFPLHSIGVK